jgi:hemin uptake protein HemP
MVDGPRHDREAASAGREDAPQEAPRMVDSACLFGNCREVGIRHRGEVYRLRVTRNGKLILNK